MQTRNLWHLLKRLHNAKVFRTRQVFDIRRNFAARESKLGAIFKAKIGLAPMAYLCAGCAGAFQLLSKRSGI